jgi:hypothetical protein
MALFSKIPATSAYETKRNRHHALHTRFYDIEHSGQFGRYQELKTYVASSEFSDELNRIRSLSYKTSPERAQQKRFKALHKHPEVKAYRKTGNDTGSGYIKEYIELKAAITSPAFLQRIAYLQNKKRHQLSEPYQKWQEYKQLAKSSDIKEYYRIQKKYAPLFAEMERWETAFCDHFQTKQLSPEWDTKPYWTPLLFTQNYSQNTEEHQLSDGRNILASDGNKLQIVTRHEAATGMAWDEKMGLIPREFQYTSGMLSTAQHVLMGNGRLEARLCFPNVKNNYHAFWLGSAQRTPTISIAHYCNKNLVLGAYLADKAIAVRKKIKLRDNQFYIFQLERTDTTLIWYINGKKLATCPNPITEPLYIAFASGIIGSTENHKLPAAFLIDHVLLQVIKK